MKSITKFVSVSAFVVSVCAMSAASYAVEQNVSENELLLIGPVDALLPKEGAAIVLGQKILVNSAQPLAIGDTAAVFGKLTPTGSVIASYVRNQGAYVPGATRVMLTGIVEKNFESVGRAVVNGLTLDLTPAMSGETV
jgi:hypothetical protein